MAAQLKTLTRFLTVGLTAAVTEYGLFYLLYKQLSVPLLIANSLSFIAGFSISFSLNRFWAFNTDADYKLRMRAQLGLYAGLAAVNLFLSNILIGLMHVVGMNTLLGKLLTMAMIATWNYSIMRLLIFSEKTNN